MKVLEFDLLEESDEKIKSSFLTFLNKSSDYKNQFLQSSYKTAFDGYSYIGQKDSLNQYENDMLHSFVLSDFQEINNFPIEFKDFLSTDWPRIKAKVNALELKIIEDFNLPTKHLYTNDTIGYMMSCNYYPKPINCEVIANNNKRLSEHTDVSLFTTFPYGVSKGLSYFDKKVTIEVKENKSTIVFPGYFSELISEGKNKALIHQVELPNDLNTERFSFALFSIPKPNSIFKVKNKEMNGQEYYREYLSLF